MLIGEHNGAGVDANNLSSYLHFNTVGGTTTINVSTAGTVGASHDQEILLTGIDLNGNNGVSDAAVIASLLSASKLIGVV